MTRKFGKSPNARLIVVQVNEQCLSLYQHGRLQHSWPVSTAKNGIGNRPNSYQTPVGAHRIDEKIGDGAKPGTVFSGRVATGQIIDVTTGNINPDLDLITSRILWLTGMEPGINQGGSVDSHRRYIYIHGTADEAHIGQPVSQGCIRMRNDDVIELFDLVETGTLVLIES